MKAAIHGNRTASRATSAHILAMDEGLRRHGIDVVGKIDMTADFMVCWSWRTGQRIRSMGYDGPILIMERGYLGDRMKVWTSLGWDGLNGHARFNGIWDITRFDRHFAADLKPWRDNPDGYALILGQVLGDMSLVDVDIIAWYRKMAETLHAAGWDVRFRPHPESARKGHSLPVIRYASLSEGALSDSLNGARIAVAWNSNSLVDAVMAGVPIYAGNRGSMVYDLASRDFNPIFPEREHRLSAIANVQWTIAEIKDGLAWDVVKTAM